MITLDIFGQEPNKKQINEGVAEGQEVDVSVVVGKLYDIIDHAENEIKNADYDRQVKYATIVRNRAIEALNMIKLNPRAANSAWKYFQTGQQGVAEEAAGKFQLPGVGSWLNVGQQQQATDDTPGNFSIVVAGRQGKDFQAITLAKALETILPRDYPRSGWPNTPGSDRSPTHYVIQEVLNRGQAVVKDGIGSKDVADSIAVKFKKYGIPAYVEGALEEARAATASFRRGNKKRAELNAMSDEERRAYDKEQQEKQRKRDDARLEREREKLAAKKKGVAEGNQTVGHEILGMLRQINRQGDDAMEELYSSCPLLAQFWDQYEGDFRSMVIELSPKTLNRIKAEISAFNQQGVAEGIFDRFKEKPLEEYDIYLKGGYDPHAVKKYLLGKFGSRGWRVSQDSMGDGVQVNIDARLYPSELEAKVDLRNAKQGVAENSMADFFAKAAQEKFPTATIRKNGQTIQEPPKRDVPKQKVDVAKLKQQYAELKKKYDQLGGDSWQYADRMMDRDIEAQKVHQQLNNLARWISNATKDNVKEQGRDTDFFGRSEPSFDNEYVKPAATSKKSKASSWADPASSDYVGRREVARRQAAQPAKVAEPQWSPATGAYSTQAAKQQRPTTPMTATPSGNGKKLTPQEYIRRIGIDEGRMNEIYAEYQDYKKLSPREFYDMYKLTKQQWLEKHRGLIQQSKLPVEEDNGVKFAAEVGSKALGNANMGLLIKAYHARTPRITLHFGDKSIDLDNEDIEAIARYYDETLTDPNDRWNFIYQTMSREDKLTALLAKIGRRSQKAIQQPGLFQEANKKKDDEEGVGKVHDVALQRAISKSKAAFPTAQSGIQALMKSFAQDQEKDQDEFEKVRRTDRRQDQLLAQISQVDKDQEKELQDLDNQNNTLAQRLQQLQSVNSKLEKQLAAMSGRKPKGTEKKAEPKAEPTANSVDIKVPKVEPKVEPKSTPATKTPNVSYKISSKPAKAKSADVIAPPTKKVPPSFGGLRGADVQDIAHRMLDMPHKPGELEKTAAAELPALQNNPSPVITPTAANDDQKQKELFAAENKEQEADYGDEYQDMVARVGQKAKQQEKEKPVDIADLARRLAAIETSKKK